MTDELREEIVKMAIKNACPSSIFGFFVCPLNDVHEVLKADMYCEAYEFLHSLHCKSAWRIPKNIRKQLPQLIREALAPRREGQCPSHLS